MLFVYKLLLDGIKELVLVSKSEGQTLSGFYVDSNLNDLLIDVFASVKVVEYQYLET